MAVPKKGVAFTFDLELVDQANRPFFKVNPTLAAGDFKVAIDGGALNNLTSLPTVSPAGSRIVAVALTGAEMTGDRITVQAVDAAGAEWDDVIVTLYPTIVTVDDLVRATTPANTLDVNAGGGAEVGSFQAGTITAATFSAGAIDAAAIANAAIDAATFAAGAIDAAAIATAAIDADALAADAITAAKVAADVGTELATELLDLSNGVETGITVRQALRIIAAVLAGKVSGYPAGPGVFRNLGDTANRVSATHDADGNRTVMTLTP